MRILFFLLLISFLILNLSKSFSQPGQWMWIHGSNTSGSAGSHGTIGVPSATNEPPALYEACEWTDANGNFWLYGGNEVGNAIANDLWKYDPATNMWTWMNGTNTTGDPGSFGVKGVASPSNRPPAIGFAAASWVDNSGNFWLFGGWNSNPYGYYSALWKYEPGNNEWTWMNGPNSVNSTGIYGTQGVPDPANYPWSREECSSAWTDDAGDLWLFSGGSTTGFNDLWRYTIATNTWTWMKGSNTGGQAGVYGTKGVENAANTPGGRWSHSRWKDGCGNLWEYGGYYGNTTNMSDLWRFNPVTNNWAWINGSVTGNDAAIYGTKCITSPSNSPGSRYENRATWTDANGNFWMFGGVNYDAIAGTRMMNDLWMYCVQSNQWTWMSGDNTYNPSGSWGTKGVSSPSNKPNGRGGAVGWSDNNGNLYLFGGTTSPFVTPYNDLWKYTIDPACGNCAAALPVALFQASDTIICTNDCISFLDKGAGATSWLWTFQGATPSTSTDQNPALVCYLDSGMYSVKLVASGACETDSTTFSNYIHVAASPVTPLVIQSGDSLICSTDPSYTAYQWYYNDTLIAGATGPVYIATKDGNYNISIKNASGCATAVGINVVLGVLQFSGQKDMEAWLFPNPAKDELIIHSPGSWINTIDIYNMLGEVVYAGQPEPRNPQSEIKIRVSSLSAGVYFVRLRDERNIHTMKFVRQ